MFKYLALPLVQTGWNNTIVNDANGDTLALMPNGGARHGDNALAAVQELTALWAASPTLALAMLNIAESCEAIATSEASKHMGQGWIAAHKKLGAYARSILNQCNLAGE